MSSDVYVFGSISINETADERLLVLLFDKKYGFKKKVDTLCKKVDQKQNPLASISNYINKGGLEILIKFFINLQVNH